MVGLTIAFWVELRQDPNDCEEVSAHGVARAHEAASAHEPPAAVGLQVQDAPPRACAGRDTRSRGAVAEKQGQPSHR